MHCPPLAKLPPPPRGKTGWPWTIETPPLPQHRPDGSDWPRISVVTPSYNQGDYIEETIRSILLQGYPDLEYVVIDGGSTDQSVSLIEKYGPWLTYWISEPDRGQAHAISKGLARSTGDIFQWINSDDVLLQGALSAVGEIYRGELVAAAVLNGYDGQPLATRISENLWVENFLFGNPGFHKEGLWFPRRRFESIGLDERLQYAFDWDLTVRYLDKFPSVTYSQRPVVYYRLHSASKTVTKHKQYYGKEKLRIRARLAHVLADPSRRSLCRRAQQQANWIRHLSEWTQGSRGRRAAVSYRMIRLALRRPRQRATRYWVGALRRTLIGT